MEGRLLQAGDVPSLQAAGRQAEVDGAGAVFVDDGPLGDPLVLAAGLNLAAPTLIGVRVGLRPSDRHPTLLAREMTTLDHLCGGRSVLAFLPPHDEAVHEAIGLCLAMWRHGTVASEGPIYPVEGAVNLPPPPGQDSPRLALDLTDGSTAPPALRTLVDLVLTPGDRPGVCQVLPA